MLVHVILAKIKVLIIVRNLMTKPALCRTGLSFKWRGIVNQVIYTVMEDIIVVAAIIKAAETMNRTNLEWQALPVPVEFTVLMKFRLWQM